MSANSEASPARPSGIWNSTATSARYSSQARFARVVADQLVLLGWRNRGAASAHRDALSNPQQPRTQASLASIRPTQLCFGPRALRRKNATTGLSPATGKKQRHRSDI